MPEDQRDRVPTGIDPTVPTAARIYDYLLGGQHNFLADQDVARAVQNVYNRGVATALAAGPSRRGTG